MADITMCNGYGCSAAHLCHRHTAVINEFRQAYFTEVPGKDKKCKYFWDNSGWNDKKSDKHPDEKSKTV